MNLQTGRTCVYSYKNDFSHFVDDIDNVDGIGYRRWNHRKTPLRRMEGTKTSQLLSPRFKTPRGTRLQQLRVRMEEKNIKRGKRAGITFKLRAIEMARENYERWHSGIAAPSIKNIFPSVFLNYSHTSSGDSKESLCRTHYRQNCRYERKWREWERLKWYEVFITNTHEKKKKVIGRESFLPLESFLPTPAIKPFVAWWLEMVSYSAMRSFSIKLLTHSPLTIILSAFPFLITIPLVAIVYIKKIPPTELLRDKIILK